MSHNTLHFIHAADMLMSAGTVARKVKPLNSKRRALALLTMPLLTPPFTSTNFACRKMPLSGKQFFQEKI
jgi:hypothetical protein